MNANTTPTTAPTIVITGSKGELDSANVWARAVCHSALGPDRGEMVYRTVPALPVLLAYRCLVDTGEVH